MKRNFIAKRFQSAGTGLTLDTAALAKYKDIVDLSASSCLGMSLAMFAILDPGDEVIVFSPYFALYRAQIELAGGVCVDVPTYAEEDYAISEERLRAAITPRTKAIIFSSRRTRFIRPTSTRATSAPSARCPAWPSAPSRSTAFPRTSS